MLIKNHRLYRLSATIAGIVLFAGAGYAQNFPCPTPPRPYGGRMLDVSRNLTGQVQPGITYFFICQTSPTAPGETTRNTYRQPIHLDLVALTPCDETQMPLTLDGYYYSQTRMPVAGSTPPSTKIGWHHGFGTVKDASGNVVGTAKFEGTIGTNTSRPPLLEGNPQYSCFVCGHHTGEITITFTTAAGGTNTKLGYIKAFYQFDAFLATGAPCDQADQCDTGFSIDGGTLDGINFRTCQ